MSFATDNAEFSNVVAALLAHANALSYMNAVFTEPRVEKYTFPFAVAAFRSGMSKLQNGRLEVTPTLFVVQIHCGGFPALMADWDSASPYGPAFLKRIGNDPTLGGKVSQADTVNARFGVVQYPEGVNNLGWAFDVSCKLYVALS